MEANSEGIASSAQADVIAVATQLLASTSAQAATSDRTEGSAEALAKSGRSARCDGADVPDVVRMSTQEAHATAGTDDANSAVAVGFVVRLAMPALEASSLTAKLTTIATLAIEVMVMPSLLN